MAAVGHIVAAAGQNLMTANTKTAILPAELPKRRSTQRVVDLQALTTTG
jgi:hypothetical protein